MERITRIAAVLTLLLLGRITQTHAQSNLVQNLNVRLVAYNPSRNSNNVQLVRITTKDVVQAFAGTAVPKGQLQLITPVGNRPGMTSDLNAFLRVTSGSAIITNIPSPASFNLFQYGAIIQTRGNRTVSHSINSFSIDFGAFHAELQGASIWNIVSKNKQGLNLGGSGTFTSNVSGVSTWDNATVLQVPTQGTITASTPKPE